MTGTASTEPPPPSMPTASPIARPNGIASSTAASGPLDRPAAALPERDAAVHDVDRPAGAVAQHQAGGDRGALPGRAHDRDGPLRVDALGDPVDVVVGHVDGAGDVARVPLRPLPDVQDLERSGLPALVDLRDGHARHSGHGAALLPPGRHAAGEIAREGPYPDGR